MFLKVGNVGAERMSSGRLFQATGSATQNARHSLVTKTILCVFHGQTRAIAVEN